MKTFLPRIIFLSVILAVAYLLNRSGFLPKTIDWIGSCGVWGPFVFLGVFIISAIFFVPSVIFAFSGGVLFGFGKGFVLSLTGIGLGALSAFLIGRYLAHDFVQEKIAVNPEFQKIFNALKVKGWKVIFLARLSPIFPFLIGNYAFGVTKISARQYFIASVLGSAPSALVYTYAGFMTGDIAEFGLHHSRTLAEWLLLAGGLVATVVLAWYLRRLARISHHQ